MLLSLESALTKYKAADFQGVIRDHGGAANDNGCPQNLLVILAQSYLKSSQTLMAAHHYRKAGEAPGHNNVAYLLIAGNLFLRHSAVAEAHETARRARALAPDERKVLDLYYRALRETCLFDEIEVENDALLDRLRTGEILAQCADSPLSHIAWCADEAINASLRPGAVANPVTSEMRATRRSRPHQWGEKLRIGYLSDDYYENHPVMRLFQGVMASHDAAKFEITHFCFTSADKIAPDGMRRHYPNLVQIGHMKDEDAATFIRNHEIDILVDLKGHTNGCRPNLVNLGLAPVQAAYLGYPGCGSGIDCDYVISDRIVTPDCSIPHYHEKLCRLPESYQANDNLYRPWPEPATRKNLGLPEDRIVFGFFNATRKITPHTFRLITRVLHSCENSVLWILLFNDFAKQNFLAAVAREGIDPARIIFAPKAHYADHLARLPAIDIALDSFPYNGHTTTSDLLWAGVPVPTYKGTHFASRVSESLLAALGVPELVAEDPETYIAFVRALAADDRARQAIRAKIAANRTTMPLFDTARFTRHLERAFEMMATRARQGLDPYHLDVPALPRNQHRD
ncbi:MAG: hypothetical protein JWM58_3197 [Rhizobium sp.]|nr:hypothetical protein [Rhizobium sp.]